MVARRHGDYGLNAAMFAVEVTAGVIGHSMGLVAEGLDNLTDAAAYGIAMLSITGGFGDCHGDCHFFKGDASAYPRSANATVPDSFGPFVP